jgi:preprotein translocase subunit SecG
MHTTLLILQIITAILLALAILIQERGSGMGEALGGTGGGGGFETTKRGAEKIVARATAILLGAFLVISLLLNFV